MDILTSNSMSITLTILALIILSVRKYVQKKYGSKKYHPFASTVFHHIFHFHKVHDYMVHLASNYKTYRVMIFPFRNDIFSSDPAIAEYILKTNFGNYGKGSYNYNNLKDLLGDGIFSVDGEKWRNQRKVSSYEFSTRVLRDFSSGIFRETAVKLATLVGEAAYDNQILDMQDLFMKSTMDSIFKVALGVELDTMCGKSKEGIRFSAAFDDASSLIARRYPDIFWPIEKFFNIGAEAKLKRCVKIVDDFVYKFIQNKADQQKHQLPEVQTKKEDILSRFVRSGNTDPKYLRDIILSFVIAGKDTTATALSWFFYMLCRHPDIQEKVAREIKEVTSTEEFTISYDEFTNENLSEESLEKMHYLHAAITETLRLYPSVPVDGKICFSDDTLPDGFSVNKGDSVIYQPYAMGRMKFIWGDDAEEYRPERWLDENGVFQPQNPFKFPAFQAGPRICLGKGFAYKQMKIFSAVMLRSFIFRLADEEKPINYKVSLTLHVDGPLNIRAISRSTRA